MQGDEIRCCVIKSHINYRLVDVHENTKHLPQFVLVWTTYFTSNSFNTTSMLHHKIKIQEYLSIGLH